MDGHRHWRIHDLFVHALRDRSRSSSRIRGTVASTSCVPSDVLLGNDPSLDRALDHLNIFLLKAGNGQDTLRDVLPESDLDRLENVFHDLWLWHIHDLVLLLHREVGPERCPPGSRAPTVSVWTQRAQTSHVKPTWFHDERGWNLRTKGFDTESGVQQVLAKPLSLSLSHLSQNGSLLHSFPTRSSSLFLSFLSVLIRGHVGQVRRESADIRRFTADLSVGPWHLMDLILVFRTWQSQADGEHHGRNTVEPATNESHLSETVALSRVRTVWDQRPPTQEKQRRLCSRRWHTALWWRERSVTAVDAEAAGQQAPQGTGLRWQRGRQGSLAAVHQ